MLRRSGIQIMKTYQPAILISAVGLALTVAGCGLLAPGPSRPQARVKSLSLATNKVQAVTLEALGLKVMRFADEYTARVAQAADDLSAKAATPDVRLMMLRWKLGQASSAYTDATGPNPVLNALDMLVLVSLSRMVVEDYLVGEALGDKASPLLETHRLMESNAWSMVGNVLKPAQQEQLRVTIQTWRQQNPKQRYVGPIRFREFVSAVGQTPTRASSGPGSIFSLLYLDPFAGMDPTTAAIEETRQTAERAVYYTQRMPTLLNWQTEVLVYQLAVQPESRQVLSNAQQLSQSAAVFAKTAEQLPKLINDQREAAVRQVFDGLAAEGEKARDLLAETRQTLTAGSEAATAINTAIQSLDQFVQSVTPAETSDGSTNRKFFNVLDYGRAADQVGAAAKDLNTLLGTLNQSTTQMTRLRLEAAADVERLMSRAFRLGVALILILLAGSVLAGLVYRALVKRLTPSGREL